MKSNVKKRIAFLVVIGLLLSTALPVFAAGEIHTFKGDKEIVLTEAGDVDLTKEELVEKSQNLMKDMDNYALYMNMDLEANVSYEGNDTNMSMDMVMKMSMLDNKNNGLEYKSEKVAMSMMGMDMEEASEEYIFTNAGGKKVSVKKETSSESGDEDNAEWTAEAVIEEPEEAAAETEAAEEAEESADSDSMLSDDLSGPFELLEKKYTDGEKNYYVMKAKISDVMGTGFGGVDSMFGDISSDADCYMLFAENGMLESLYMDLSGIDTTSATEGTKTTFTKYVISLYTDASAEIVIPAEVQTAGDAVS